MPFLFSFCGAITAVANCTSGISDGNTSASNPGVSSKVRMPLGVSAFFNTTKVRSPFS